MDAAVTTPGTPALTHVHLPSMPGSGGVVWSVSPGGFHANLVVLAGEAAVDAHRNDELDVLVVVLDGAGALEIDGDSVELGHGDAVLVPRGSMRSITTGSSGLRYLTVHGQRGPLGIGRKDTGGV